MAHDPESEALRRTLEGLRPLLGTWRGTGHGDYPTIDAFEYREELRFTLHDDYPMIAYEQKTVLSNGEASHWEMGFLRPGEDDAIELSNVQDSGRVEVLRGRVTQPNFEFQLKSVHHGHDPRMVQTERSFKVDGDELHYEVRMSTRTTPEPQMQVHLRGILRRQDSKGERE